MGRRDGNAGRPCFIRAESVLFRRKGKNHEFESVDAPMELHPHIIEKEGKKEFVVLPYEEFMLLEEAMSDYEVLKDLREEKEKSKNQPSVSLDSVISDLGL
jgi:hypothetical protein